ncbi:hypothetical protein V039C_0005 [Vibrio phage V039C]|nr:hypothetical protein V039C_0005 [Vibrio phage V039C]
MDYYQFTGSNTDEYSNREKIWLLAKRHNQQSIIKNGAVTCRRHRVVSKTKPLPLT